jgi:hypothetical protein
MIRFFGRFAMNSPQNAKTSGAPKPSTMLVS